MIEPTNEPTVADVSALAYQLYEEDGRPEGQAADHWRRAEDILRHPETRPADNILSPPSEPEITRALDARAEVLDAGLPSDPHSGPQSWRQSVEIAAEKRDVADMRRALSSLAGIEKLTAGPGTVRITYDSRQVSQAAIIDCLTPAGSEAQG
jgi:copper chaperone CopZ